MSTTNTIAGRGAAIAGTRVDATDLITEVIWARGFDRDHTAVRKARIIAEQVVVALRREGLLTGTQAVNADEVLNAIQARAASVGELPARGISHLVAEALVLFDLPEVHRDAVESLLPDVDMRGTKATMAMQFRRALRKFNGWGWIDRRADGVIAVRNREALVSWFTMAADLTDERAATTLDLAKAVAHLKARSLTPGADQLRIEELRAIDRVMRQAPGAVTNARGQVRVVPRSRPL